MLNPQLLDNDMHIELEVCFDLLTQRWRLVMNSNVINAAMAAHCACCQLVVVGPAHMHASFVSLLQSSSLTRKIIEHCNEYNSREPRN